MIKKGHQPWVDKIRMLKVINYNNKLIFFGGWQLHSSGTIGIQGKTLVNCFPLTQHLTTKKWAILGRAGKKNFILSVATILSGIQVRKRYAEQEMKAMQTVLPFFRFVSLAKSKLLQINKERKESTKRENKKPGEY